MGLKARLKSRISDDIDNFLLINILLRLTEPKDFLSNKAEDYS